MEQPTDMFSMYLKFIPVILAVIFWIYCLSSKYSLSRMETMRQLKRWGNDSNLLIVFYVQIMPDDFIMQLHRF